MITQVKFDRAYDRIVEMRNAATIIRRALKGKAEQEEEYHGAYCRELAFSQALSLLEDADRDR